MTPSEEMRSAAKAIRETAKSDIRSWRLGLSRMFDQVNANMVADWLEQEAQIAEEPTPYGDAGQSFVYDEGDKHPALLLARAINSIGED